jgi:hypothetical protein
MRRMTHFKHQDYLTRLQPLVDAHDEIKELEEKLSKLKGGQ